MLAAMTAERTDDDDIDESGPNRRCIVTGASLPIEGLIRFVVAPDGVLTPDLAEKLPGRGLWLTAGKGAAETAEKKKLFAKAARRAVTVPEGLAATLERLLVKRCQDTIRLAKRSGQLTVGHDRVLEAIDRGGVGIVGIATDAGGERRGIERAASQLKKLFSLDAAEIGAAAGKERVSFLTVGRGGLASALARDSKRLSGFRQMKLDVER